MEKLWNKNYSGSPECALSRLKGPYTMKRKAEESKSEMESLERVVSAIKAGRILKWRDAMAWRKEKGMEQVSLHALPKEQSQANLLTGTQ